MLCEPEALLNHSAASEAGWEEIQTLTHSFSAIQSFALCLSHDRERERETERERERKNERGEEGAGLRAKPYSRGARTPRETSDRNNSKHPIKTH